MVGPVHMAGVLDPRSGWTASRCTIAKAVDLLSTKSAFLLLREAFYGTTRFDDFAERVGISEPVAAARLRDLVAEGLLAREDYQEPGQRRRQGYVLTAKGADLLPAIVALQQWGDRWLDEDGGPVEYRHRDCGRQVTVELRCTADHKIPTPDALDLTATRRRRRRS